MGIFRRRYTPPPPLQARGLAALTFSPSSVVESVTLADAQTVTFTTSVSQIDSMALADTPTATAVFAVSITESMVLSDTSDSVVTKEVAQTDSMALADASTVATVFSSSQTDSVALTDAPTATTVIGVSQTDSMALADAPTATAVTVLSTLEVLALSSSQDATVIPAFAVPLIFGADELPRRRVNKERPYREELEEDLRDVIASFSKEEVVHVKVAQEIKEIFITIIDSVDDAAGLAVIVAGLPVAVNSIVKAALFVVQEQQTLRALRQREEEILLL